MIEQGQQFRCYVKRHAEVIDGEAVNSHRNLLGEDCTGQVAFDGLIFTCERVELSHKKGIVVHTLEDYELRKDHFRFEVVE